MKFSMWLEKRNQHSATKMPKSKSAIELHTKISGQIAHNMQHGKAGVIQSRKHKGNRGEKNRNAIKEF